MTNTPEDTQKGKKQPLIPLHTLPTKEKKVASKVLVEQGYTTRMCEKILGVDYSTVSVYSREEVPEELLKFEKIVRKAVQERKMRILFKALDRLDALVPQESKISELVKALEYVDGKSIQSTEVSLENETGKVTIVIKRNND